MSGEVNIYVSPQGDDTDAGTLDRPFRTPVRARDEVRKIRQSPLAAASTIRVTVWFRGGRYELEDTFDLEPQDSGREDSPVVYRAYGEERPILSGGRAIRGWKPVREALPGLSAVAQGRVWAADVPGTGDSRWTFRQLWADGHRLVRARWPKDREARITVTDASRPPADALAGEGNAYEIWRKNLPKAWRTIQFDDEDMKEFSGGRLPMDLGNGDAEVVGKNIGRWATVRVSIDRADGTRIATAAPLGCLSYYWGDMRLMIGDTGYVENALSLLSQAGEWYLDAKAGRVYYLPADDEDPNAHEFIASKLEQLVRLRGTPESPVQFIELRGLRLEHAEWTRPSFGYRPVLGGYHGTQLTPLVATAPIPAPLIAAGTVRPKDEFPEYCLPAAVELIYARECRLELCRVGHVGASGIGLTEGCRRNCLVGCEVFDAGGHGIHAGLAHGPICAEDFSWGRPEDEPRENEISNCYVHHTGQMDWGAYGVLSSYCRGNRLTHNLIEQQPYSGLCACFTCFAFPSGRNEEITVEYNHIHHVMLKLFDGGAIYTKDGVSPKSTLRGNVIHDIGGNSHENNGIFLDDGSYGFFIADNVIYNVGMPIRFNGTAKEKFAWGVNYLGTNDFPSELAAKAGLMEPYKSILLKISR